MLGVPNSGFRVSPAQGANLQQLHHFCCFRGTPALLLFTSWKTSTIYFGVSASPVEAREGSFGKHSILAEPLFIIDNFEPWVNGKGRNFFHLKMFQNGHQEQLPSLHVGHIQYALNLMQFPADVHAGSQQWWITSLGLCNPGCRSRLNSQLLLWPGLDCGRHVGNELMDETSLSYPHSPNPSVSALHLR